MIYIRFVTSLLDEDTNLPIGVFSAAYRILDGSEIDKHDRSEIRKTLDWFKFNLPVPDRFRRSRKPNRQEKGICWFKSEATECMSNVRYLVHLVSEQNINVREIVTDSVGYLIYEDEFQIVAEPFSSTKR